MSLAHRRTLRFALGTSLCLTFSQAVAWDLAYLAPVMTLSLLGLPLPAMKPAGAIKFLILLGGSLGAGLLFLPLLLHYELAGLLVLGLALWGTFYLTAKGGPAVLGSFLTIGIALTAGIGTVSVDALLTVIQSVMICTVMGLVFMWLAHGLLPDSGSPEFAQQQGKKRPAPPPPPPLPVARRRATRSLLVVLPIVIWFLLSGSSASYAAVLIKGASMGQQATTGNTVKAAKGLLLSTLIGGIGAVLGWHVLKMAPHLFLYTLVIALAALVIGRRIFAGLALAADGPVWSYGLLTMIIILAPAVMDSSNGAAAGAAFWSRLLMFAGTTVYSVVAVWVADGLLGSAEVDAGEAKAAA
jgi:hypothetical protein